MARESSETDHSVVRVKRTSGMAVGGRQLRIEPQSVDLRDWSQLADETITNQKQAFTRWINEQLRKHAARCSPANKQNKSARGRAQSDRNDLNSFDETDSSRLPNGENGLGDAAGDLRIADIHEDLRDGVVLIKLVESLSGKRIRRANRSANLQRTQWLDNMTLLLNRLEEDGIRLVNINSTQIVDGNLKLTLGLTWTLIRHYSIAKPHWSAAKARNQSEAEDSDASARKRLLEWINERMPPGFRVRNFDSNWTDGRALCALVNGCVPGSFPGWDLVGPVNAFQCVCHALDIAEARLGIAKLIEPGEMLTPAIDERVMMTYLAQFPNAQNVIAEQSPSGEIQEEPTYLNAGEVEPTYLNTEELEPTYLNAGAVERRERVDPRALFDEFAGHQRSQWRPLKESELRPPSNFEPEAFRVVRKKKNGSRAPPPPPSNSSADKYTEQTLMPESEQVYDTFKLFERADEHAISVSQKDHSSFRDLIWQLIYARDIQDDLEKVRVLFMWLCTKDLSKLHFDNVMKDSPEEKLLQIRDGEITYTEVFELLCSYAGVQCEVVDGYVKTHPYVPGMRMSDVLEEQVVESSVDNDGEGVYENPSDSETEYKNSAGARPGRPTSRVIKSGRKVGEALRSRWNAVLINGTWQLIDCNWAARSLVFDDRSKAPRQSVASSGLLRDPSRIKYRLHMFYFLPNPAAFLYSHYPDRTDWQLVERPIVLQQYEQLPWLRSAFFEFGLELRSSCAAVIEASRSETEILIGQKNPTQSDDNEPSSLPRLAERMQFTFSFWFNSGLDNYQGYPLWHYVMNEFVNDDNEMLFRVRFPLVGEPCRLTIYAKLLTPDPTVPNSDEFRAVCEFMLQAKSSPPPLVSRDTRPSQVQRFSLLSDAKNTSSRSASDRNSAPPPPSPPLQPVIPFPPCRDCLYGPSAFSKQLGLRLTRQSGSSKGDMPNFLHVQDGTADLKVTLAEGSSVQFASLRFRSKLKAHSSVTTGLLFALDRFVVLRTASRLNEARLSVFMPQAGEYALELFVQNDSSQSGEDAFRFAWRFMLVAAKPSAFGEVLPPLPSDFCFGAVANVPVQLNITSVNQLDPFISRSHFNENEITLKLNAGVAVRTSVHFLRYSRRSREPSDFSNFVLQQQTVHSSTPFHASTVSSLYQQSNASPSQSISIPNGSTSSLSFSELELIARLPKPGFYVLKLFAQPLSDTSSHLYNVFNFLLCTLSPATSNHSASSPFPKQSTRWLEGCYLHQPTTERIVAARTHKGSVWFKLTVPGANTVCVVIGDVWRALEKRMEVWVGEVNLYRIVPKRDPNKLVICASFDEQREQYQTLLDYIVE